MTGTMGDMRQPVDPLPSHSRHAAGWVRPPRAFRLRAVLFDFDGTLTAPGAIDFEALRRVVDCPPGTPILEYVAAQSDPAVRAELMASLGKIELEAAALSVPSVGAEAAILALKQARIPLAIISRNDRAAIDRSLDNFESVSPGDFDVVLTRDVAVRTKPEPDAVLWAANHLGVRPEECLMVGDFIFDVMAGNAAGAVTVLVRNHRLPAEMDQSGASLGFGGFDYWVAQADYVIDDLEDLPDLVRLGLPLPLGKFPNDLLETYVSGISTIDPAVIISAGIGEDIAAVDVSDEEVLVLKADPITFATDAVGQYVVLVNANDIATSGATPRWLLATFLFPAESTPSEVLFALKELQEACYRWGIGLCGGHTEITDAVTRPVVSGAMAGTVTRRGLIDKRGMRPGDRILLTKALAVEGTALIAREFGDRLQELGMTSAEVEVARGFLDQVGVLAEARLAADSGAVTAMHDVTEGGLATAIRELSAAGGHRVRVDWDAIPVFPQTRRVCEIFGLDPLGLIGSGSLLICCRAESAASLMAAIGRAGILVTEIGLVLEAGAGVEAFREGVSVAWPAFAADEVARLF